MSYGKDFNPAWDLTLTRAELDDLAPKLLATLREFVGYGLCRQANTAERKMLAEHYRELAAKALKDFPKLKLNYSGCDTRIVE